MRAAVFPPTLVVPVLLVTAACTSEEEPAAASVDEYCTVFTEVSLAMEGTDWGAIDAAVGRLREVGTPAGTPQEAADGAAMLLAWERDGGIERRGPVTSQDGYRSYADLSDWSQATCAQGEVASMDEVFQRP